MIILPICVFVIICCALNKSGQGWRESFLRGSLWLGTLFLASSELLSGFHQLTCPVLTTFWAAALVLTLIILIKTPGNLTACVLPELSWDEILTLGFLFLLVALTGLNALVSAPNNWDSLTYHLPRVEHWLQNKSLTPYPTADLRQIFYPPFSSLVLLQLKLLSHSDRLYQLVQWASMLGCLIGVSLITKFLGGNRRSQITSALVVATIPMGLLQAVSTQNNTIVAFALVCCVALLLKPRVSFSNQDLVWAGVALGLAVLTKGTALIFGIPFLIWQAVSHLHRSPRQSALILIIPATMIFLCQSGFLLRNSRLSGSLIPPSETGDIYNQNISFAGWLSTSFKTLGQQLASPWPAANDLLVKGITALHHALDIDITDRRWTFGGHEFLVGQHPFHEDHAGNPMHTLLALAFMLQITFSRQFAQRKCYLWTLVSGMILFCLVLKFQPWNSRFLLPFFVLLSVIIALALADLKSPALRYSLLGLLALTALPWALLNDTHPLLGKTSVLKVPREQQYFANNPGFLFSYRAATDTIKSSECRHVGLLMASDSWEYPLWALLADPPRLQHIQVNNLSGELSDRSAFSDFSPCLLISDQDISDTSLDLDGRTFVKTRQLPFLSLWQVDPSGALAQRSLKYYFNDVLRFSANITAATQRMNSGEMTLSEALEGIVVLRQRQLRAARMVSRDELNALVPGLGDILENKLIKGITVFLEGLSVQDQAMTREGEMMIGQWELWLRENLSVLKNKLSD